MLGVGGLYVGPTLVHIGLLLVGKLLWLIRAYSFGSCPVHVELVLRYAGSRWESEVCWVTDSELHLFNTWDICLLYHEAVFLCDQFCQFGRVSWKLPEAESLGKLHLIDIHIFGEILSCTHGSLRQMHAQCSDPSSSFIINLLRVYILSSGLKAAVRPKVAT